MVGRGHTEASRASFVLKTHIRTSTLTRWHWINTVKLLTFNFLAFVTADCKLRALFPVSLLLPSTGWKWNSCVMHRSLTPDSSFFIQSRSAFIVYRPAQIFIKGQPAVCSFLLSDTLDFSFLLNVRWLLSDNVWVSDITGLLMCILWNESLKLAFFLFLECKLQAKMDFGNIRIISVILDL